MNTFTATFLPQALLLKRFSSSLPVERIQPDQLGELCSFFSRAYADQPLASHFQDPMLVERRWRWCYEHNPVRTEQAPAWICRHRGKIVGHLGLLPVVAVVQEQAISVAWIRDLIVAPEARSLGVGALLVLAAREVSGHPLLVAGMNEQSVSLFRQLGFADGKTVPLYLKVYDPRRVLETLPRSPVCRLLLGAIQAGQSLYMRAPRFGRSRESVEVVPLERFDDRFDRWWASIEPCFPSVVRRTAETMRWRYEDQPAHRYRVVAARDGEAIRGVAVLRCGRSRGLPAGFITELLAHPDDSAAVDALLIEAERWLAGSQEERPAFLRCTVRHPAMEQRLVRAGFLRVPSPIRWMLSAAGDSLVGEGIASLKGWFLNGGDSDLDVF